MRQPVSGAEVILSSGAIDESMEDKSMQEIRQTAKTNKTITAGDTAIFCTQVALILKSGIPLYDGVPALCENVDDESTRAVFQKIDETVKETGSLYQGLKAAGVFPSYMVNMVNIGEKSGKLEDVMESLAAYYEREDKLKSSIRGAILYPLILIVMMAVVIGVLIVKVLPIFNQVFQELGSEMSATSTMVMNIGMAVGKYALILLGVVIVVLLVLFLYSKTKRGGQKFDGFFGRFFLTKKLSQKIASGRFASITAMMLSSGYDVDQTLDMIPDIITNKTVIDKVAECKKLTRQGETFATAIVKVGLFSGVYARMISVGFSTGSMDTVMKKLADIYEEEIDDSVNSMVSIIEPTMVAVLSIIIGAILLSVMLPLMGIMSSIG